MERKHWIDVGPAILLATGIIVSTAIAALASGSERLVLAAPLLMALTIIGADMLGSRLRGNSLAPSWSALVLGIAFLAACTILSLGEPALVAMMIPILGGGFAGAIVVVRAVDRRRVCRGL